MWEDEDGDGDMDGNGMGMRKRMMMRKRMRMKMRSEGHKMQLSEVSFGTLGSMMAAEPPVSLSPQSLWGQGCPEGQQCPELCAGAPTGGAELLEVSWCPAAPPGASVPFVSSIQTSPVPRAFPQALDFQPGHSHLQAPDTCNWTVPCHCLIPEQFQPG